MERRRCLVPASSYCEPKGLLQHCPPTVIATRMQTDVSARYLAACLIARSLQTESPPGRFGGENPGGSSSRRSRSACSSQGPCAGVASQPGGGVWRPGCSSPHRVRRRGMLQAHPAHVWSAFWLALVDYGLRHVQQPEHGRDDGPVGVEPPWDRGRRARDAAEHRRRDLDRLGDGGARGEDILFKIFSGVT